MCSLTDIDHIVRDELRMSRQDTYMRQCAQLKSTDDRFSRDAVYTATQQ